MTDRPRAGSRPDPDDRPHDVLAAEEFELPASDPRLHVEPPHDVLAAEEFELPAGDPRLHVEPPHDVLAAEEFELPAEDPALHREPVDVPAEPGAGPRAHDVLAADEFAVPAGPEATSSRPGTGTGARSGVRAPVRLLAGATVAVLVARVVRRRR